VRRFASSDHYRPRDVCVDAIFDLVLPRGKLERETALLIGREAPLDVLSVRRRASDEDGGILHRVYVRPELHAALCYKGRDEAPGRGRLRGGGRRSAETARGRQRQCKQRDWSHSPHPN
jgi:hypothetical protein